MTDQDRPRFTAALAALFKTFNRPADANIAEILFLTIQHLDIIDAEQCISQAILTCEKFPTPVELKRCIALIPRRKVPQVEYKPTYRPSMAIEAQRLINKALDGTLDQQKVIEGMMYMDRKYPGAGWATEASALVQFYRMNQLNEAEAA